MRLTKAAKQFYEDLYTLYSSYRCKDMLCSECIPEGGPFTNPMIDYYSERCPVWKSPDPRTVGDTTEPGPKACHIAMHYMQDNEYLWYFRDRLIEGETPVSLCARYHNLVEDFIRFAVCPMHKVNPNKDLRCECCVCKAFARVNRLLSISPSAVYNREDILEAVKTLYDGKFAKALARTRTMDDVARVLRYEAGKLDSLLRTARCEVSCTPCDYHTTLPGCYSLVGIPCQTCLAYRLLASIYAPILKEEEARKEQWACVV